MRFTVPLFVLVSLALVVGYLLGTEAGRAKRDELLVRLGRTQAEAETEIGIAEQVIEEAEAAAGTA